MKESKQQYLQDVLDTHKMAHMIDLLEKYKLKRQDVKEKIEKNYNSKIYTPINSGSFAKHTAINSKFDLDLAIPFKRDSFGTLEELSNDIYELLNSEYANEAIVRKQKVSIGISFFADEDGDVISLDIVPGRELNKDQYIQDKKLNLYVFSQYGSLEEKTYIQTNINAQIDHIKAKENERKIIRLLKIWKNCNNEPYKSFFLELLTIKAFKVTDIKGNLWDQLESVLSYIKGNVKNDGFTLLDPGNTNNNVANTLTDWEREQLSQKIELILSNIENSADHLKIYFPKNKDYEKDENQSNSGGYAIKSAAVTASIPPKKQRFG